MKGCMAVGTCGNQLSLSCLNLIGDTEFSSVKVFSVTVLNLQVLAFQWLLMVSEIGVDFRLYCQDC